MKLQISDDFLRDPLEGKIGAMHFVDGKFVGREFPTSTQALQVAGEGIGAMNAFVDWSDEELALKQRWESGETVVANLKNHKNLRVWAEKNDIYEYIGNQLNFPNVRYPQTVWANEWSKNKYGLDRDEKIKRYTEQNLPRILETNDIESLRGKILFCWCHPEKCHGDVLVEVLNKGADTVVPRSNMTTNIGAIAQGDMAKPQLSQRLAGMQGKSLEQLENFIQTAIDTSFVLVGAALGEIQRGRLYKLEYTNFNDYCYERWGFKKSYAHDLIRCADVFMNLSGMTDTLPSNPRQALPLAQLTPELQRQAWGNVTKAASPEQINYRLVEEEVARLSSPKQSESAPIDTSAAPVSDGESNETNKLHSEEFLSQVDEHDHVIKELQERVVGLEAENIQLKQRADDLELENESLYAQISELQEELESERELFVLEDYLTAQEINELITRLKDPVQVEKATEWVKEATDIPQVALFARMGRDSRVWAIERQNNAIGVLRLYAMCRLGQFIKEGRLREGENTQPKQQLVESGSNDSAQPKADSTPPTQTNEVPMQMSGRALSRRLGWKDTAIVDQKRRHGVSGLREWLAKQTDPDGYSWRYDETTKLFYRN
jgi:FtsZ-binding cell division protein ZapB